jgi:hypothetical protein
MWLDVLGRMDSKLNYLFRKALELDSLNKRQVVLFCAYSSFDIPVGHTFTYIQDHTKSEVYKGDFVLEAVSQQMCVPIPEITHGWKTVCKFEFSEGIPDLVKDLREIKGWDSDGRYLTFIDSEG